MRILLESFHLVTVRKKQKGMAIKRGGVSPADKRAVELSRVFSGVFQYASGPV